MADLVNPFNTPAAKLSFCAGASCARVAAAVCAFCASAAGFSASRGSLNDTFARSSTSSARVLPMHPKLHRLAHGHQCTMSLQKACPCEVSLQEQDKA